MVLCINQILRSVRRIMRGMNEEDGQVLGTQVFYFLNHESSNHLRHLRKFNQNDVSENAWSKESLASKQIKPLLGFLVRWCHRIDWRDYSSSSSCPKSHFLKMNLKLNETIYFCFACINTKDFSYQLLTYEKLLIKSQREVSLEIISISICYLKTGFCIYIVCSQWPCELSILT